MLTTKEAIEQRRSIRKFKNDMVSDEHIMELIDAARLAPSGSNAQPWRFKVVKDPAIRIKLAEAAYDQQFVAEAPLVIVCCADTKGYLDGTILGAQELGRIGAVERRISKILEESAERLRAERPEDMGPRMAANVAIAIEHIALRALDFGLGSCWVRMLDEQKIRDLFGLDDNIYVVALLPIGYPDESPQPRRRLPLQEILLE